MMQKWNLQDIRPAGAKPVQKNPAVVGTRQDIAQRISKGEQAKTFDDMDLGNIDVVDGNRLKKKRIITTVVIALIIIFLGFITNVFIGGAEVTVHPKYKDISIQASFTAYAKPEANALGYELLTLEATGEKQVESTGKEKVSERSEGKIFVYNTKSISPQRLIKNTRFETPDGLIYRIKESIEVPGIKKTADGTVVPGSVAADVFADGTGEQYNIKPSRFTVPGLKGTDQYDSVYGESNASFTGGFEGERYTIDDTKLATSKQALHIELRDTLLKRLKDERPAGFIMYDDSITFTFDSLPSTSYGDSLATIKERARLQVPMFKESDFSTYVAKMTIPEYKVDQAVKVLSPNELTFAYDSSTTTVSDIAQYQSLDFTIKGETRIIWQFNEEELKTKLLGLKKVDATKIFGTYTAINSAQAEIRPFWSTIFPKSADEIKITVSIQ